MADPAQRPERVRPGALPGSRTSCALLTVLTILLAWPTPPDALPAIVRPCYFALLFWFFWVTKRGSDAVLGRVMSLVCSGFLVLWLGYTAAAVIHFAGLEPLHEVFVYLRHACEHGALFLLGSTLIAYGLMLWIPQVLQAHQVLGEHFAAQRGELQVAARTRSQLEERLVEADRRGILGELAATIAHDLRNPLTIVKGTAESMCRRARTPEEIAGHTEVIRRNIDKADRTIASLIELGKPRTKEPATQPAAALLHEVLELVQVEGRRRKLGFAVRIDDRAGAPAVHADATLLAQALLNLLLNAMQASPAGRTVVLRARRSPFAPGHTVLAVEDRGSGLPAPVRMSQFVPFFTTKPEGTGLGLSSCRRIAAELGGRLALYPRHRGGARAMLLVPAVPPADSPAQPRSADERDRCPAPTC